VRKLPKRARKIQTLADKRKTGKGKNKKPNKIIPST